MCEFCGILLFWFLAAAARRCVINFCGAVNIEGLALNIPASGGRCGIKKQKKNIKKDRDRKRQKKKKTAKLACLGKIMQDALVVRGQPEARSDLRHLHTQPPRTGPFALSFSLSLSLYIQSRLGWKSKEKAPFSC